MMKQNANWYDDAVGYDLAFSFPPEREISFLLEVFRRFRVPRSGLILEPMIGAARLVPGLLQAGFRVIGFDKSRAMLARAKLRWPSPRVFVADSARFEVAPQCDAAHCLIDSFRYLRSVPEARMFLESVARALKPGAPFALGLTLAEASPAIEPPTEDWTTVVGTTSTRTQLRWLKADDPNLEWMEALVEVNDGVKTHRVTSRLLQRRWKPKAFVDFLNSLEAFDVAGIFRRTYDLSAPLEAFPEVGGPVVVLLQKAAPAQST